MILRISVIPGGYGPMQADHKGVGLGVGLGKRHSGCAHMETLD